MGSLMCLVAVSALTLMQRMTLGGPTCYECLGVKNPSSCHFATICTDSQQCYTEEVVGEDMDIAFNLGCEKRTTCSLNVVSVGRRRETPASLSDGGHHPVTSCFKCCNESLCNNIFCRTICHTNPCLHGGTCTSDYTGKETSCLCPPGYTGVHCETDIDECQSNPCPPGAVCQQGVNAFSCSCPFGYEGSSCEIKPPFCVQCQNASDTGNCSTAQRCSEGEDCFTEVAYVSGSLKYLMGCRSRKFCEDYINLLSSAVGIRAREIIMCFECCPDDLCNLHHCINGSRSPKGVQVRRTCQEYLSHGYRTSGVYTIDLHDGQAPFEVYCDMVKEGRGWVVFQRRQDGSENFFRGWNDYKYGFGNLENEFWLGNEKIHRLTQAGLYHLRVELEDWENATVYAEYKNFTVADAAAEYTLRVSVYNGTAGDALTSHSGHAFSTFDADHDSSPDKNCAAGDHGAWWYTSCYYSNLNGDYGQGNSTSLVRWIHWQYGSLQFTEMKLQ